MRAKALKGGYNGCTSYNNASSVGMLQQTRAPSRRKREINGKLCSL